jgi:uncharacterized membrane protein YoaK (UPF0700 family)
VQRSVQTARLSPVIPLEPGGLSARRARLERRPGGAPQRAWFALLLASVAGSVDAIGYLTLFQLFIAHMSGNSVRVGIYIGQRDWGAMFERAFPIPMLVLGVVAGGLLTEVGLRKGVSATLSVMLLLECILLAAFALYGDSLLVGGDISPLAGWRFYLAVALPTLALGVQNAALRRVGGHTVRTTFVTGMLTDLAEAAVAYAFWFHDTLRADPKTGWLRVLRRSPDDESLKRFALYTAIWLLYVIGAVGGTIAVSRWELGSLVFPVAVLALIATWNAWRPILPPEPT